MIDIFKMNKDEIGKFIEENKEKQKNEYIIRNRGFVTASMMKSFEKSTEAFFKQYICEIEPNKKQTKSLAFWTLVDDYVSYWEDKFYEMYYVDRWYKKEDLVVMCQDKWLDTTGVVKVLETRLFEWKSKISVAEFEKFEWVIWEWKRQPLFNYEWNYETQKELIVDYKWLKLKATLDRVDWEKWLLRDMKTTNNVQKFNFQILDYWYDFSMSFYNIMCELEYKKSFTVILDACQTTFPYPSSSIVIPPETMVNIWKGRIIPLLIKLSWYMERWEKTKDPNIWLEEEENREMLYWLDMYSHLESSIQKEFEIYQ